MTELEAAQQYSCNLRELDKKNVYDDIEVDSARIVGFKAGTRWQAKQSPWISVEERLPEDNQLVLTSSGIYGTKLLVWNDHYKVWDDEDGDDVYCERDKIDAWMPIPE